MTPVFLNDMGRNRQSQPCSSMLGAEKRRENQIHIFLRDASPRIADADLYVSILKGRTNRQLSSLGHGLKGVFHDVQENLAELFGIEGHRGCGRR